MPDRVVRAKILTSDLVNQLSWAGEVFYRRLMSVVDDYGRYEARNSILRASLYPLKLNQVSEADIAKWKNECSKAGLVSLYEVESKEYLMILQFNQRLRAMKSKYPAPDNAREHPLTSDSRRGHPLTNATESETETETETDIGNAVANEIFDSKKQRFLIPEMQRIFKQVNPAHLIDTELDFQPLLKISSFIAKQLGIENYKGNNDLENRILKEWGRIAKAAMQDEFLKDKPLGVIFKMIQSVYNRKETAELQFQTSKKLTDLENEEASKILG